MHTATLYINEPAAELAAKVAEITPGDKLTRSFFTNSGSEADETAMLVARLYTGRQEIIALRHGYHGRTMLAMSAAGHSTWRHGGTAVAGIQHWATEPDVITFAKGMANGSPIGCTTTTDEIANALKPLTFSTFGGNPVTSAAALATIRYIEENDLPRNAAVVGAHLRERL